MNEVKNRLNRYLSCDPIFGEGVFVARTAVVLGAVTVGDRSGIWYQTVLRADLNRIEVGHNTNIQDNAVLHVADDLPCVLGDYVTIGHAAVIHACTIGDETLIGMGATILDGAVVGSQCLVGANTLITGNTQIPDGSLVLGSPGKVVRELRPDEKHALRDRAEKYAEMAAFFLDQRVTNPKFNG
jgi:gamma-carbonic anhydrase